MKLIEIQSTVDKRGQAVIPAQLLQDIGLRPGDNVRISYASDSAGMNNTYQQFVIKPNGIAAIMLKDDFQEDELTLPNELLEAAGISAGSDLEIVCSKGAIVIMEADLLDSLPDELCELFADLGISPDAVREVMRNGGCYNE